MHDYASTTKPQRLFLHDLKCKKNYKFYNMKNSIPISNFSETELIKIIEDLIKKKTNKDLIRDDCFYYSLKTLSDTYDSSQINVVFNFFSTSSFIPSNCFVFPLNSSIFFP